MRTVESAAAASSPNDASARLAFFPCEEHAEPEDMQNLRPDISFSSVSLLTPGAVTLSIPGKAAHCGGRFSTSPLSARCSSSSARSPATAAILSSKHSSDSAAAAPSAQIPGTFSVPER